MCKTSSEKIIKFSSETLKKLKGVNQPRYIPYPLSESWNIVKDVNTV